MKVAVPYEIDDNQRLIIGAIMTGKLEPATREQIQTYCTRVVGKTLESAVAKLEKFQTAMAEQLVAEAEAIVAGVDDANQ